MYLGAAILKPGAYTVGAQVWQQPAAATTRLGVCPNTLCPVSLSSRNLTEIFMTYLLSLHGHTRFHKLKMYM